MNKSEELRMSEKKKNSGIFSQKPKAAELAEKQRKKAPVTDHPQINTQVDTEVTVENLPAALAAHFEQLTILEKKIQAADSRAQNARILADNAKKKSAGFLGRKKAVEALQDSNISLAQAQSDVMDAVKVSFVYQQKISKIINQMLLLCVSNLAGTRTLLSQLQDELKKVERGDYSEETKTEMAKIIRDLKEQEDMMSRQAKQSVKLQEHEIHMQEQDEHLQQHDVWYAETAEEVARTNQLIAENQRQIEEMSRLCQSSEAALLEAEKKQRITIAVAAVAILVSVISFFI